MKTRVKSRFDHRIGMTVYDIEVLDHFRDQELLRYYPDNVSRQCVRTARDRDESIRCAEAVAAGGSPDEIIAEFGESDLVEHEQKTPTLPRNTR